MNPTDAEDSGPSTGFYDQPTTEEIVIQNAAMLATVASVWMARAAGVYLGWNVMEILMGDAE